MHEKIKRAITVISFIVVIATFFGLNERVADLLLAMYFPMKIWNTIPTTGHKRTHRSLIPHHILTGLLCIAGALVLYILYEMFYFCLISTILAEFGESFRAWKKLKN